MDAFLKERNDELEALKASKEKAHRAFLDLQTRKRREEDRLASLVGHFLEGGDNPITTSATAPASGPTAAPAPPNKPDRAS
jgi:hypothetical protein